MLPAFLSSIMMSWSELGVLRDKLQYHTWGPHNWKTATKVVRPRVTKDQGSHTKTNHI